MLNFFKNLFGAGETETHGDSNGNGHGYTATATAPPPVQVQARAAAPQRSMASAARPGAMPTPRMPVPASAARVSPNGTGNVVHLPLHVIIAVLPLELKTRIRQTMVSDILVTLPLDQILVQLGSGVVKISYGELRALAPNVFSTHNDLDQTEISLPLNEILPQINPALIARRQSQKQVQIPEDIHGPFGKDSSGVSVADPRTAARPIAPTPPPQPAPVAPPVVARNFQTEHMRKPAPQVRPVAAKPFTPPAPAAPAPEPDPIPMIPFRSSIASTPTPRAPSAMPAAVPPVRPAYPASRGVGATPLPTAAQRLPAAAPTAVGRGASVPHAQQAAPAAPAGAEAFLSVPLAMVTETWPEVLRTEIVQLNLSEAHLALPVRFVESSLKQGKVAFTWKVLRSWIRPATLPTVSAHDGMMLELPLRIIAPLFLHRSKQIAKTQQKVQVSDNIPNLFFGFPQPEAAPAPAAPAEPAEPTTESVTAPMEPDEPEANFAPELKAASSVDTNFYVWNQAAEMPLEEVIAKKPSPGTDFLTRYATPNEVVSRASALDGVAGALVALPDGLMVASKLSADLNGDTLAAFLPHIFGKVSQCTKELRMGELNNLHFTVGNVPWKIFRVNAIFFAAFGHAGRPLPTAQLAALAGELDRKK